jgi:hypothetical protein
MNGASSPCGSVPSETEPNRESASGRVRSSFCILAPEIEAPRAGLGNYGGAEAPYMPDVARVSLGDPTDVTDGVKDRANRGGSAAAGVVTGA